MTLGINFMQPATGDPDIYIPMTSMRRLVSALAPGGEGLLRPNSSGVLVTHRAAGANWSVDVGTFDAFVKGDDIADQGTYHIWSTATENVATPSAPPSGTRIHRLIAQVRDKRATGSYSTYDWQFQVLQDPGTGIPSLPASALHVAQISIAAGQSNVSDGNITNDYYWLRTMRQLGPWYSDQANPGSYGTSGVWEDFSGGNWAPVQFTVPESGIVKVTIMGRTSNTTGQTTYLGWHISGTDTVANNYRNAFGGDGNPMRGSAARYVGGLTPGATDTVTPSHLYSGGSPSDNGDGQLIVEAVH